MFFYEHLPKISPDGYRYIMDLAAGQYGIASLIESKVRGQLFVCKIVEL